VTLLVPLFSPVKVSFTNVETAETHVAQLNPKGFAAAVGANYANVQPPGAGYEPVQFSGTGNPTFPVELLYVARSSIEAEAIDDARRFFLSLLYPRRGQSSVRQKAPPRVLYVWPEVASVVCVLRSFSTQQQRATFDGMSAEETFSLQLEECRSGQMFSEDARAQGFLRPSPRALGGQNRRG